MDKKPVSGQDGQDGLFASAVWDNKEQSYIVKVINTSDKVQPVTVTFAGLKKKVTLGNGTCITLHADNPDIDNTIQQPNIVSPKTKPVSIEGNVLNTEVAAQTFAIYKFKAN